MENNSQERAREEAYLAHVITETDAQLVQARDQIARREAEMVSVQRDVFEDGARSGGSLSSADGFESLIELNQSMMALTNMAVTQDNLARTIARLEALRPSPYFARIDFLFDGDKTPEKIYIGRTALLEEDTAENLIYDWRAPIAGVFYQFMTGPAYYDAPVGRIKGEVTLKRQFEIEEGRLTYFFDTDMTVNDGILKAMMAQNASPQMRAIVETIQRDQDTIIRNLEADCLVIQGVAGSGKTAIALHRAAYLMYQGLANRLSAKDIFILSPNSTFSQYIAAVLPALGEENVPTQTFDELCAQHLKGLHLESQTAFLERCLGGSQKAFLKRCLAFKTSSGFREILDAFAEMVPAHFIAYQDIRYDGQTLVSKNAMRTRILERPELPLATRLSQLESRILGQLPHGLRRDERAALEAQLHAFTQLDLVGLYEKLWQDEAFFAGADIAEDLLENLPAIRRRTLSTLRSGRIAFDDAICLLYLALRLNGSRQGRHVRQVILDEAQDLTPLQFAIIQACFPNARATILGDANQSLIGQNGAAFFEEAPAIFGFDNTVRYALDKSFRCSSEILRFSLQFLDRSPAIEAFNRSGDAVTCRALPDQDALLDAISSEIEVCRAKGYESICLITKNEAASQRLYSALRPRTKLHQLRLHDEDLQGTLIMPVYMSKGLEFDAVILCDTDSASYQDAADRHLLYVTATRALHHLAVFCEGRMTPLITAKEAPSCTN